MENYYEVLNVAPTCTLNELKANYKKLLLQHHPDKKNTERLVDNNEIFLSITKAWNCLKDPIKRKQYDAELMLKRFEMHENVFANITISQMVKQHFQSETNAGVTVDSITDRGNELKWYYTYNCRCGGQYILFNNNDDGDESIEQEERKLSSDNNELNNNNYDIPLINNKDSGTTIKKTEKKEKNSCNAENDDIIRPMKNDKEYEEQQNDVDLIIELAKRKRNSSNSKMASTGDIWLQWFSCCFHQPNHHQPSGRRRHHQRLRIDRSMIGSPTNFVHTGHIGSADIELSTNHLNAIQTQMQSKGGYEINSIQIQAC